MEWWVPILIGIGAALALPVLGFIIFSMFRSIRDAVKAWMGNHIKWFVLEPKKAKSKEKEKGKEKNTNSSSWKDNLLQKVMSILLLMLIILVMYILLFQNG